MEQTIKFKDLSGWLKLSAIAGWIMAVELTWIIIRSLIIGWFGL